MKNRKIYKFSVIIVLSIIIASLTTLSGCSVIEKFNLIQLSNPVLLPESTVTPKPTPTSQTTSEPTLAPTSTPITTPSPVPLPTAEPLNVRNPYYDSYPSPYNSDGSISNKKLSWYITKNKEHEPPMAHREFEMRRFDAYYLGNINNKIIYLTFNEGYDSGNIPAILDILREKNVQAAFFVNIAFIRANPQLAARIAEEGHIIANHSANHLSLPDIGNEQIVYEIEELARYYNEVTGYEMPKFFRPPSGEYCARVLEIAQSLGYHTIFWSAAHVDWDNNNQLPVNETINTVLDNLHPGEILMLHSNSSSNLAALPRIIDAIHEQGYKFSSLYNFKI